MEIIDCPECLAPAEVQTWATYGGTGGAVEHVHIQCVRQHVFLMPRDMIAPELSGTATDGTADEGREAA